MTEIIGILFVLISGIFASVGSIFLKKTSVNFGNGLIRSLKDKNLVLGGILYLLGTIFMITSLKFGDLSVIYPFVSITYIWIAILSIKFMNEKMTKLKLAGFVFIILGVALVLQ